ncbi:MAG: site-specific DNA-methyltransferase [Planctomycetota bacterium]|nr:MAG: site-specific DNA-methyltransferase [Planctomycetota bacterium]
MPTKHTIICGDSRHMQSLPDQSTQLVVTSPPYWQLKDYGTEEQIGFNDSYEDYINNLNLVWKECHRVLENGCRLCINIGDQFARSVYYGRYKIIPIRTEIIKFCETIGFDYMGAIIWQKVTTCNTTGGATIMGSFPNPRNGILKIDYEFILLFKKPGKPKPVSKEIKNASSMTTEQWNQYFSGHWNFSGERQDKHLAMFPEELPKRLIKMFSFVGDTVLDPFLGSGTTTRVAVDNERNSVGYEINEAFLPIIRKKIGADDNELFVNSEFCFESEKTKNDYSDDIKKAPYIFKDTVKFDKKVDPKKLRFGSRIDNKKNQARQEYYTVKRVVSPEHLILSNNLKVRLIGIHQDKRKNGNAVRFLEEKLKGQQVFMKFDSDKYDENNILKCYLYLKNKTFINAHLIKNGMAHADLKASYRHKNKFIQYEGANNG